MAAALKPWFRFFRLPNLPTAPGDALAGAAFCLAVGGGTDAAASQAWVTVVASGVAALLFYLFGLADNDLVGLASAAPDEAAGGRPLATGEISVRAARIARAACLAGALGVGFGGTRPPGWGLAAVVLAGLILAYNRTKNTWLMGACRGASALCGAAAAMPFVPASARTAAGAGVAALALGLTLYVAAVTKLSEGEERPSEGLGNRRYLLGLTAFAPLASCAVLPPDCLLMPAVGCLFAFWAWCAAVAPLWRPHGPPERRRAVGRAVGALLYLHIGFLMSVPRPSCLTLAAALWLAARLARRLAPDVTGS